MKQFCCAVYSCCCSHFELESLFLFNSQLVWKLTTATFFSYATLLLYEVLSKAQAVLQFPSAPQNYIQVQHLSWLALKDNSLARSRLNMGWNMTLCTPFLFSLQCQRNLTETLILIYAFLSKTTLKSSFKQCLKGPLYTTTKMGGIAHASSLSYESTNSKASNQAGDPKVLQRWC